MYCSAEGYKAGIVIDTYKDCCSAYGWFLYSGTQIVGDMCVRRKDGGWPRLALPFNIIIFHQFWPFSFLGASDNGRVRDADTIGLIQS